MSDGDWITDAFDVGCLGTVAATGTRANGLLSSAPGACSHRGLAIDFTAYWTAGNPGGRIALGAMAVAPSGARGAPAFGARVSDGDAGDIRDLLEEALEEWWATDEAKGMATENERRDAEREARRAGAAAAGLEVRKAALVARLSREVGSVSEMEGIIRELAETERMAAALRG